MAKQKTNHSIAQKGEQKVYQVSHEEDDNLLPSAEELLKYQQLDAGMIDWIKNRCDLEQRSRIEFNNERLKLTSSAHRKSFFIDIVTIVFSALVVLSAMMFSYLLIMKSHVLSGSLFAGGTVILYGIRMLNFRKNRNSD